MNTDVSKEVSVINIVCNGQVGRVKAGVKTECKRSRESKFSPLKKRKTCKINKLGASM